MYDVYAWWRSAIDGKPGPIHDGDPQCGFYRRRTRKNGPFVGVAIYPDPATGEIVGVCDRALVDGDELDRLWLWVAKNPVTEDAYRDWEKNGIWPDDHPTIEHPEPGHNQPPADNEIEALRDQIASAKAGAGEFAEIKDDKTASKAQAFRARLNELSKQADKKRDELKRPHLEAGRAIDKEWMPLVKDAKAAADQIRKALSAHETRKARAAEEARRKAEEEQRRREAEAAKAAAAGMPAPAPEPTPQPEPAPTAQIKGAYGKAASVREVLIAEVVDQDAAYQAMRTHPELVDLIRKLAQRAVNAGHEIAGVKVVKERRVA